MRDLHVVLPDGVDDLAAPSGGNSYDREVCQGLTARGWSVRTHAVAGSWPYPDPAAADALRSTLASVPDGATVLLDGLVGSLAPEVLVPQASRLRIVVLVHMPFGIAAEDRPLADAEADVLRAAAAVITTSAWTRDQLLVGYLLPAHRVTVAPPGVAKAPLATATTGGTRLLCVAAVARHKGQDVLFSALGGLGAVDWRCRCVGPLDREPAYLATLRNQLDERGISDRVTLSGPLSGEALDEAYAAADLLVVPSRFESFGMVILEALARGIPVVTTAVGGTAEALGQTEDGRRPGTLVGPGAEALRSAIDEWLREPATRERLRAAARDRRTGLQPWQSTVEAVEAVLQRVATATG